MTTKAPRTTRIATALAALMMLFLAGGCDNLGNRLGLTGKVAPVTPRPIGPERLRVSLPTTGARATLAPVARNHGTTVWQTLDGITLAFRQGVLTGTRGLGDDLMTSDVSNTLRMLRGAQGEGYYPHIRSYLDGEMKTVFQSYQCRRAGQKRQPVRLGGTTHTVNRIEESCVSPDKSFTNIYWLDPKGAVIKSRQWVSPAVGYMETERVSR